MLRNSRLLFAGFAALALVAAACSDSTSPPAPTTIVLSSAAVALDAVGATQTIVATVKDQRDQPMPGASVTWSSSTRSVTATPLAGAAGSATIAAVLNGESVVTATSGAASATVKVVVAQVPTGVQVLGGNGQIGQVNAALFTPIGVRVVDRLGAPAAGQTVSFSVAQGGGSLSTPMATTNADGAAFVSWTLGKSTATSQQVTAAVGALPAVTFTAVATAGAPTSVKAVSGDAQTGQVGQSLGVPPSVLASDAFQNPVPNISVAFVTNSGTVAVASVRTNDSGIASAGLWTLGGSPGAKTLTASVSGAPDAVLTATAQVGPPAAVSVVAGNNQSATIATAVAIAPSVRVTDAFANVIAGAPVTFQITAGGGAVAGATTVTDANGVATAGGWTLGPVAGTNTLAASAGTSAGAAFTAQGLGPTGTPSPTAGATATAISGSIISGPAGSSVSALSLPAVSIRDANGNALAGVTVSFAVTAGGGTVTGANATTNAAGIATVGSWMLGGTANMNTVTATVTAANVAGGPFIFTAAGCEGGGPGYTITVCYRTAMTPTQRQAFVDAAARWQSLITSDLPDITVTLGQGQCDTNSPSINSLVDDLVIFAAIEPIDGLNNILGSAGWCLRRTGGLPVLGVMRFDIADVQALEASGRLNAVILHEMGHVIGIGTMWTAKSLLQLPSSGGTALDTYFSGASGIAGFNAIGGLSYTGGQKVPVENTGGSGTINAHWRESVLANELMTGFLNSGSNPLSQLTVRSLEDIGYTVNAAAADPFSLVLSLRSSLGGDPDALDLSNDVFTGPQFTVDTRSRIVRIR